MAVGASTPRDQLERILNVVRRAMRYVWLAGGIVVAGAALSVLFALSQEPAYESEAVLFHQERIQSSLLSGREVALATRNLGDRYRDILLARSQLREVVQEFDLAEGEEEIREKVEELRQTIKFRARGAGTFAISYTDSSPARAQRVTQRLTDKLIEEDKRIRRDQASVTVNFLLEQKDRAEEELRKRERRLASFLADHPEFVADEETGGAGGGGAGIRAAARNQSAGNTTNRNRDARLNALERQRNRLRARLDAPDRPQPTGPREPTEEEREALRQVEAAQREVDNARRNLQDKQTRFTARHPDVIEAKKALADAQQRLRRAEAAVPSAPEEKPPPPINRDALRENLRDVERQIAARRAELRSQRDDEPEPEPVEGEEENWVVALETEYARLNRLVTESRDRVDTLDGRVFTAEINASSQMAEQGAQLAVIDEAHKPIHPAGKSKKIIVLAGLLLFSGLAGAVALGLALLDDRVYTRYELEQLDIAPVLVVVPKATARQRKRQKKKAKKAQHG